MKENEEAGLPEDPTLVLVAEARAEIARATRNLARLVAEVGDHDTRLSLKLMQAIGLHLGDLELAFGPPKEPRKTDGVEMFADTMGRILSVVETQMAAISMPLRLDAEFGGAIVPTLEARASLEGYEHTVHPATYTPVPGATLQWRPLEQGFAKDDDFLVASDCDTWWFHNTGYWEPAADYADALLRALQARGVRI